MIFIHTCTLLWSSLSIISTFSCYHNLSFEEKVLEALDKIEKLQASIEILIEPEIQGNQIELDIQFNQTDQLLNALNRKEEGELLSQPKSNPKGPYLAKNFNNPLIFSDQSTITLGNELVIDHPYTTI